MEGAVLYSSFSFFKHFQSQGKNSLMNVCRGINFSVRDENIHAEAGAWLFKTLLAEGYATNHDLLRERLYAAAAAIYEHEKRIIEMIFDHGDIPGLDKEDMKTFIKSRINLCLNNLGYKDKAFEVNENPIADWFYLGINGYQLADFFTGVGSEYQRNRSSHDFTF